MLGLEKIYQLIKEGKLSMLEFLNAMSEREVAIRKDTISRIKAKKEKP